MTVHVNNLVIAIDGSCWYIVVIMQTFKYWQEGTRLGESDFCQLLSIWNLPKVGFGKEFFMCEDHKGRIR